MPVPTIKHYLREGLLPEPVKTSRNMAYYPPEFVDRIRLIKRLQEERFMPLKAIKAVLDEDPERAAALLELEDRILDRALAGERARTSAAEVRERYGVPKEVLDRLAELEVLTPNSRGYSPSDVTIIEAIGRFRAGGYDEQIGFTVYDTLRYKTALEELVREEVDMVMNRLAGEVSPERVVEMLEAGAEPLQDLIAALHTKLMVAELERHRASGPGELRPASEPAAPVALGTRLDRRLCRHQHLGSGLPGNPFGRGSRRRLGHRQADPVSFDLAQGHAVVESLAAGSSPPPVRPRLRRCPRPPGLGRGSGGRRGAASPFPGRVRPRPRPRPAPVPPRRARHRRARARRVPRQASTSPPACIASR